MQNVVPFRAWRYDPRKAGDLARLIAPPYDVVDEALQSRLYARSPHNIVRVDLGMTTPSDSDCDNRYTRAAAQLEEWKAERALIRDSSPSVTFVQEEFTGPDGRRRTRHGFLALLRLHEFGEGVVFPHERTLSGPKEDRFRLLQATRMSLSPVFMLYDLPGDDITKAWRSGAGAGTATHEVRDPDGGPDTPVTRLWPVFDVRMLELITRSLSGSRFLIADGHHRYETALRYRRYRQETETASPASEYVLAYFTNASDPALAIFGTHRLVKNIDPALMAALPQRLEEGFEVERLGLRSGSEGDDAAASGAAEAGAAARGAIAQYLEAHPRGAFAMWGPALDGAYGFRVTDWSVVRNAGSGGSRAYQQLDVTVLQTLVLQKILGITVDDMAAGTHVSFFKDPGEAFERLTAADFQVGFFMNPTGLDQVREVAFGGERMPQKATFFYPKLPTGLVFHDLSGDI